MYIKLGLDDEDVDVLSCSPSDERIVLGGIKGGISLIPFVGPIIVGAWDGYWNGRLNDTIDELSKKISKIDENKIDKEFISSEEFFDLIFKALRCSLTSRCKPKAKLIVGMLSESICIERDRRFSTSFKEAFLFLLDQLTEEEMNFLSDFSKGQFRNKSKAVIYEKEDKSKAIALDMLLAKNILNEENTWEKNITTSMQGTEFIEYIKLLSSF